VPKLLPQNQESYSLDLTEERRIAAIRRIVDREFYTRCGDLVQVYAANELWGEGCGDWSDQDDYYSVCAAPHLDECIELTEELETIEEELDSLEGIEDSLAEERVEELVERKEELEDPDYLSKCTRDIFNFWLVSPWLGNHYIIRQIEADYVSAKSPIFMVGSLYVWAQTTNSLYEDPWIIKFVERTNNSEEG
jgi:hypothetical protein